MEQLLEVQGLDPIPFSKPICREPTRRAAKGLRSETLYHSIVPISTDDRQHDVHRILDIRRICIYIYYTCQALCVDVNMCVYVCMYIYIYIYI